MSRNVFADIGFSEKDAGEMALRVSVAVQIKRVIKQRDLKQRDAARLFGVPQPTISKINTLRLTGLSLSLLIRMLLKAGLPFQLSSGGTSQSLGALIDDQVLASAVVNMDWPVPRPAATPDGIEFVSEGQATGESRQPWPPRLHLMVN